MAFVALSRLLTTKKLLRRETLIAVAFVAVYGMVYRTDGYSFLLFLAILTVGFIDIDYRKILKVYVFSAGVLYCATLLAGLMGVITNFVRIKGGLRSAWGMSYPTDCASLGLFLLMALWVVCKKLPDWTMMLITAAYGLLAWFITRSITSTICTALLFGAMLYHGFESRYRAAHAKPCRMEKCVDLFATLAFPALALCIFGLMLAYARGLTIGYRIDALLSRRLQYQVNAFKIHGLNPFGTPFVMNGDGFSVFPQPNYTFVDSSYVLILLRYGWVTFIMLCLSWCWTVRKAIRCEDRRLVLIMGIIAIHSFSEHHFIDSHFNVLVTMPLAAYMALPQHEAAGGTEHRGDPKTVAAWAIAVLLFIAAACMTGPGLLAWMKTVLEIMHYGHGEHGLRLVCVLIGALAGACLVAWAVSAILKVILNRGGWRACLPAVAVLAVCAVAAGGIWLYGNRRIDAAMTENGAMIEADREALEIAVKAASGKVRSGVLPTAYAREIEGIDTIAFFEDDMARLRGDSVLLPSNTERGIFIDNGFLYIPVSDAHAIYSGDREVVEALARAGYHPTGYYSGVQRVDLEEASMLNELVCDPETGLRLDGASQGMRSGPWQDLYGGRYTATWTLSLPEGVVGRDGVACTLSVSTDKGENVLLEKEVRFKQFDEQGRASVSVPFVIQDSRKVAFEAWAEPGCRVDIREISFVKTPNYDVHTFYNGKLKRIRDEYYNAGGERVLRKDGWSACDYEYDRYGNVALVRYYDCEDQLTLIRDGYAQRRFTCDAKGQVVREEFCGTDGALIIGTQGYAAVEREYDAAGNAVVERYYDENGEPYVISAGYAEVRRAFNDKNQAVHEAYYGVDGARTTLAEGYSGIDQTYDGADNVASIRYLDADDRPVVIADGYAAVRKAYDGLHQVVREAYLDAEDRPALNADGYAAIEREYDEVGNAVVLRFYGVDDQPAITSSGYAEVRRDFNARKQVVRELYFGVDGKPAALGDGQYGAEIGYDDVGNQSMRRYLDADGQPMTTAMGYAEVRREFNSRRQKVRETYYGVDGQPVALTDGYYGFEQSYDEAGNVAARRYLDDQGNATMIAKGYAQWRRTYNAWKKITREEYFGIDGEPVLRDKGYAAVEYVYGDDGALALTRYYDLDGTIQREEPAEG